MARGRKSKKQLMEINQNNNLENKQNIDIEKIESKEYSANIIISTTTTCTSTMPRFLYQIWFGDEEGEYYSWEEPSIKHGFMYFKNLMQKGTLSEDLIDEVVSINFRIDLPEALANQSKDLVSGIVLKIVDPFHQDQKWIKKDVDSATIELKEESIKAYRALIPTLINKVNSLESIARKNNNNSNLMNI